MDNVFLPGKGADDDGVIMATYLEQSFRRDRPSTVAEVKLVKTSAGSSTAASAAGRCDRKPRAAGR